MSKFYNVFSENNVVRVELQVPVGDVMPEDLVSISTDFLDFENCDIYIGGRGPAEVYAALAYHARKCNPAKIVYKDPKGKEWLLYSKDQLKSLPPAQWFVSQQSNNRLYVSIIPSPHEGNKWQDDEICPVSINFEHNLGDAVVLSGRGAVHMYALLAIAAAQADCDIVLVDKPQYSFYVSIGLRDCGNTFPKSGSGKNGIVVGILGDPNSGKSVFSKSLSKSFACINIPLDVWLYDCDFASPTSDWYIDGTFTATDDSQRKQVEQARQQIKRPWTSDMQLRVAKNLTVLRHSLDITLADMPGGRKKDGVLNRIPDHFRAEMMKQCDYYIILGKTSEENVFNKWRQALREYGLEDRVLAEFTSSNPEESFSIHNFSKDDQGVFHADLCGLDRKTDLISIAKQIAPVIAPFIKHLRYSALATAARGALTKTFLTKEGGTRYGAAVLTTKGTIFSSGQYSSFNHSTNIHAEMNVVSMAAAAGEPDVVALALATNSSKTARPCGVCRQVLMEHAQRTHRDFDVVMLQSNGDYQITPISELLPYAWESHTSSFSSPSRPKRQGRVNFIPLTNGELQTGEHVLFQKRDGDKQFLAMVWDNCLFPHKALLKIKYASINEDLWEKIEHSFTQSAAYLGYLYDNGLSARNEEVASVGCLLETAQIKRFSPMPIIESNEKTKPFLTLLSQAGISPNDVFQTGSRSHGLSAVDSDYDLIIKVTPEQIKQFRQVANQEILSGAIAFPENSGSIALLSRILPQGVSGMISQQRFLETLNISGTSFACIFVPPESLPAAIPDNYTFEGRTTLVGTVSNADYAPYKRSQTIIECQDKKRIRLLCYHKAGNMLKNGDQIAVQGYLYQHKELSEAFENITYTLVQVALSTEPIVWSQINND